MLSLKQISMVSNTLSFKAQPQGSSSRKIGTNDQGYIYDKKTGKHTSFRVEDGTGPTSWDRKAAIEQKYDPETGKHLSIKK